MPGPSNAPVLSRPLSDEEKEKVKAETALAKIELKLKQAQLERELAEHEHGQKLAAEELKQERATTKLSQDEVRSSALSLEKLEEAVAERKAGNKYHHVYMLDAVVSEQSVGACISQLEQWRRLAKGPLNVTLRIFSPGGDVIAGMYLYDYIKSMQRDGHTVNTEAYGYAASMGGILLQAGNTRRMGKESYILIHEISFGVRGKVGEVEDEMEFVKKMGERVLNIFAARAAEAGGNGTASEPLTKSAFKRRWSRKDWWLSSDEALKYGVVDEVL